MAEMAEMAEMKQALDASLKRVLDIEGVKMAVVTDTEGNLLGSGIPSFAQAVACIMDMVEGTYADLGADPPDEIICASKSERVFVMRVNPETLLAVRAELEANQQLVSLEILGAAIAVKELMEKKGRKQR